MLKKVEAYVAKWHMLEKGDKVIVGVSGGADSVCLLFVLLEFQKKLPFELTVVHVHHGIRGAEADADEKYVRQLCEKLGLSYVCEYVKAHEFAVEEKLSEEEAGRKLRQMVFSRVMRERYATKIALAHHMDDNAETLLFHLARGTGLKGLGGIRPVTGNIIRPLLCLRRGEIEAYLREQGIPYCEDATNQTDAYTRNRIRNHVLPYIEQKVNARAVEHMQETMERLGELQSFVEEQKEFYFQQCVKESESGYILERESFLTVPKALKALLLKELLARAATCEKDIEAVHIALLQELLEKQVGRSLDLPYGLEAKRVYEGLRIGKKKPECSEEHFQSGCVQWCVLDKEDAENLALQKEYTKYFDYDIITDGVCVRTRQAGDYISIHEDGRTQKLKTFFINEKIPQEERERVLLVADGSHILWIVGHRTNPYYRVRRNTKHILKVWIDEGEG